MNKAFEDILRRMLQDDPSRAPRPKEDVRVWEQRALTTRDLRSLLRIIEEAGNPPVNMVQKAYEVTKRLAEEQPPPGGQIDVIA